MATTPNWSIVYPVVGTTMTPLANHFAGLANSADTALNNLSKRTAYAVDNQAARDALFPSPTQGDRVFRRDKGLEDIYLAVYNASTNPYGAPTAGWYLDGMITGTITASGDYSLGGYSLTRKGRRVVVNMGFSRASDFGTNNTAGVIPAGFRPSVDVVFNGTFFTGGYASLPSWGIVETDGEIKVNPVGITGIRQLNTSLSWDVA